MCVCLFNRLRRVKVREKVDLSTICKVRVRPSYRFKHLCSLRPIEVAVLVIDINFVIFHLDLVIDVKHFCSLRPIEVAVLVSDINFVIFQVCLWSSVLVDQAKQAGMAI